MRCDSSSSRADTRVSSVDSVSTRADSAPIWRLDSAFASRVRRSTWLSTASVSPRPRCTERVSALRSCRSWATSCCRASPVESAQPPASGATAARRSKTPKGSPGLPFACRAFNAGRSFPAWSPLTGLDQEVCPPILLPAALVLLAANRALLAIRDDRDAVGLDALRHEVVHGGLGAALAQREVVLVGTALVAVSLDEDQVVGVGLQPRRVAVEDLRVVRPHVVPVEVEEHVLEIGVLGELTRPRRRTRGGGGGSAGPGRGGGQRRWARRYGRSRRRG